MLTDGYTFKLGDQGVVLNSDVSLPFVDIRRVVGLDSTPYRETERQHEGVDGGFMDAEFEQGKSIILEGTVYAGQIEMESFLDRLKQDFAPSQVPIPFYFRAPGVPERVVFVKPLGMVYAWEPSRRIGEAPCQFRMFAEDPRVYTSDLQSVVVNVNFTTAITGFEFDFAFDFSFGASLVGNARDAFVSGNRPTPPVLVIDVVSGPIVNPRIVNLTYNRTLAFEGLFNDGDSIRLDPYYRTVVLNGTSNRRSQLVVAQWFLLQPGSNFIGFRSDTEDASTLTIQYRDAWR